MSSCQLIVITILMKLGFTCSGRRLCLGKIDRILPLVLCNSDQEEALSLKFFTKLIAPVTLPEIIAKRETKILKGIAWELGRDPYQVSPAVRALRTAAVARRSAPPREAQGVGI